MEYGTSRRGDTNADGVSDPDVILSLKNKIPNYAIEEYRNKKMNKFLDVVNPDGKKFDHITNKEAVIDGTFDIIKDIFQRYNNR